MAGRGQKLAASGSERGHGSRSDHPTQATAGTLASGSDLIFQEALLFLLLWRLVGPDAARTVEEPVDQQAPEHRNHDAEEDVEDLHSRHDSTSRPVGHRSVSRARCTQRVLWHHSERASQSASLANCLLHEVHAATCGTTRPPNCWNNSPVVSFVGMLTSKRSTAKTASPYKNRAHASEHLLLFYNRKRTLAALDGRTPVCLDIGGHNAQTQAA